MSTNVLKVGFSVPFKKEYQSEEMLKEIFQVPDDYFSEDFIETLFEYQWDQNKGKNQGKWIFEYDWQTNKDKDEYGIIYLVEEEREAFCVESYIGPSDVEEGKALVPEKFLKYVDMDRFGHFTILYYNGGDAPFRFCK